jgi:hypothetical protein
MRKEGMLLTSPTLSCCRIIGEVGSRRIACLPDVIPCLLRLLNDEVPAVVRQAIKTGTVLFAKLLQHLVIQVTLLLLDLPSCANCHLSACSFSPPFRDYSPLEGLMMHLNRHGSGFSSSNPPSRSWHFRSFLFRPNNPIFLACTNLTF